MKKYSLLVKCFRFQVARCRVLVAPGFNPGIGMMLENRGLQPKYALFIKISSQTEKSHHFLSNPFPFMHL